MIGIGTTTVNFSRVYPLKNDVFILPVNSLQGVKLIPHHRIWYNNEHVSYTFCN